MKLSQKKNCINCYALGEDGYCKLGDMTEVFPLPIKPVWSCYKPKTKKQFERAKKLINKS